MAELKPCAHCGSEALVRKVDYYYEDGGLGMSAYEARCTECGARTLEYRDEDDAIEAWNRRATDETCAAELTDAERTRGTIKVFECSKCGKSWEQVWADDFTFCPYCGRRIEYADE